MFKLNPQQDAAVKYIDGPLLVLAGAGSGKTRVITQKIAYLIEKCGYKASTITALTFTNKAAREMKERVASTLDRTARRGLTVSTFHNLGLNILRKECQSVDLKPGFSLFDDQDSLQLIRSLMARGTSNDKDLLMQIQSQISNWKNDVLTPNDVYHRQWSSPVEVTAAKIYLDYESHLKAYNALDFDDLILRPVQLFKSRPEVLERWQNKIRYLLVDEYQDTNSSQYLLVQQLVGVRGQFTVVGDDDQSIYAWRGAKPENLALLKTDYPRLKIIKLEQNYRSCVSILKSANHLIANNPHVYEKKLWSDLGYGDLLRVITTQDDNDEAEQVTAEIISHKLRTGGQFKDYAILYRGNHQSRVFEKSLRNNNVPYKISGGQSFFSRGEIKDIFAYIRLICNPDDDNAFLRIVNTPKRGIGSATLEKLGQYASERQSTLFKASGEFGLASRLSEKGYTNLQAFQTWLKTVAERCFQGEAIEALKEMIEDIDYERYVYEQYDSPQIAEKRMANVWDLIQWIDTLMHKEPDNPLDLNQVVERLILLDILDRNEDNDLDQVQLMTLHASKGLEFPHVYLVGMEEEFLPHRTSIEEDNIEEERRLAYVGITRAQRTLCFTLARQRRRYGEMVDCVPSRFLDELPEDDLEWRGRSNNDKTSGKQAGKSHLSSLKALLDG